MQKAIGMLPDVAPETATQVKMRELMEEMINKELLYGTPSIHRKAVDAMEIQRIQRLYGRELYGRPIQPPDWLNRHNPLNEDELISTLKEIEKAFNNFALTERRLPMVHEIMEIVIGRIGLALADEHGQHFDSFSFYAKVKGRPE